MKYNIRLMISNMILRKKLIYSFILITLGIMSRTVLHAGPNVEFVTAAVLLSSVYLGRKWSVAVAVSTMLASDLLIGNTNIFIFTWSAYIVIGISGYWLRKVQQPKYKILAATCFGLSSSVWFYLWTNFGVWFLDSWGMYPKTIHGLMQAYIFGLPFLKYNIFGNIVFIPAAFTFIELARIRQLYSSPWLGRSKAIFQIFHTK